MRLVDAQRPGDGTPPCAARLWTALAAALVAVVAVGLVHYGGPTGVWSHVHRSLEGNPSASPDVSKRLLTLGNAARLDQFHVAVEEWRGHRLLGTGAGTYAQYWMAARSNAGKVLDVHNLYLETLAELGLVGLLVVAAMLACRCRQRSRRGGRR